MSALDFSYARPGGATLANAGVTSVGRYLSTDGRGITLNELTDYLDHNVSVWFIKENSARGMLNGYPQGAADAGAAQQQLNALGQPNAVVYFTADFDIQPSQFSTGNNYLKGVQSIIPVSRIGLYAGIDYLNHAAGLYTYQWKTASSSFDHGQNPNTQLHLIQTLDAVPIPNTDYDIIVQANHGQVGALGPAGTGTNTPITEDDMTPEQDALLTKIANDTSNTYQGVFYGANWTNHDGSNQTANYGMLPIVINNQALINGLSAALTALATVQGLDAAAITKAAHDGAAQALTGITLVTRPTP